MRGHEHARLLRRHHGFGRGRVERPDEQRALFGLRAARQVQHVAPVGQEAGEPVRHLPAGRIEARHRHHLAARGRHAVQRRIGCGREDDDAVPAPGAAKAEWRVAQDPRRPVRQIETHQLAVGEERDRPVVGRPERQEPALGAGERLWLRGVGPAQPQAAHAVGADRGEDDARAVVGDDRRHVGHAESGGQEAGARRRRHLEVDDGARRISPARDQREGGGDGQQQGEGGGPPPEPPAASSRRRSRGGRGDRRMLGDPAQLQQHIVHRRPALRRVLGDSPRNHVVDERRHAGNRRGDRRRVARQDGRNQAGLAGAAERRLAGEHLVEHGAERKDVGPGIHLTSLELFRRHVLEGAENGSLAGEQRGRRRGLANRERQRRRLGQPEVEQLDQRRRRGARGADEEDIGRLEIAMHDAAAVSPVERLGDRHRHPEGRRKRQRAPGGARRQRSPSRYSMTRKVTPPSLPTSCSVQMLGWFSCEMARASRSRRARRAASPDRCDGSTLMATWRSSRVSRAR